MISIDVLAGKNYKYLKGNVDKSTPSKQRVFEMVKKLSSLNDIGLDKLISNEKFVRKYIRYYSIKIDEVAQWEINFNTNTNTVFSGKTKKLIKSVSAIKDAYSNFEKERLLKLLPEKQDEAPTKQRKKI